MPPNPILCSALYLIPREMFSLKLCHSSALPGVLGSSSLSLPLWVPLQCPLDYMSILSPQHVANPFPRSLSYLLIYWPQPCLSPKLLVANFSRSQNRQDVPQALSDEHLQLLLQSLSQPPHFRIIQEHCLQI